MLILDLVITPERDTLPIHSSQPGKKNRLWMSAEIEGKLAVVLDVTEPKGKHEEKEESRNCKRL